MPDLVPVDYDPFNPTVLPVEHDPFADQPLPKAGQTIQRPDIMGGISSLRSNIASGAANVTGLADAAKALRGEQTPDEAQMFALGALPALIGGPEAKAAEEVAPAIAKGIRAFHGSPYDFNAFDMSKIGTGEGAQAYGHGLYFAENPSVAEEYKKTLTAAQLQQFQDDLIKTGRATKPTPPVGKTYEVNINADPEHFLDWDKPLSEQHPKAKEAINNSYPNMLETAGDKTIQQAFPYGMNPAVTQTLRDAGIPGIKYLDQGSRSSGDGTRNYVVFNDKLIDIVKKYGMAGLIAGGAAHFSTQPVDHDPFQ